MKIRNLTSKVQEVKLVEFVGGRELTIYVEGNATTDIQGAYIYDSSKLKGIFEIIKEDTTPIAVASAVETTIEAENNAPQQTPEETDDTNDDSNNEIAQDSNDDENSADPSAENAADTSVVESNEDKFICKECGAEFGSARGLASHMNRVHSK